MSHHRKNKADNQRQAGKLKSSFKGELIFTRNGRMSKTKQKNMTSFKCKKFKNRMIVNQNFYKQQKIHFKNEGEITKYLV